MHLKTFEYYSFENLNFVLGFWYKKCEFILMVVLRRCIKMWCIFPIINLKKKWPLLELNFKLHRLKYMRHFLVRHFVKLAHFWKYFTLSVIHLKSCSNSSKTPLLTIRQKFEVKMENHFEEIEDNYFTSQFILKFIPRNPRAKS